MQSCRPLHVSYLCHESMTAMSTSGLRFEGSNMSHQSGCPAALASCSVRMAETDELSQQNPEQNPERTKIDASQAPCRPAGLTLPPSWLRRSSGRSRIKRCQSCGTALRCMEQSEHPTKVHATPLSSEAEQQQLKEEGPLGTLSETRLNADSESSSSNP